MSAVVRCVKHWWAKHPSGSWYCRTCGEVGQVVSAEYLSLFGDDEDAS